MALAVIGIGAFAAIRVLGGNHATVLAVLVMMIPGRVQGLLYRPLFRGRMALEKGEAARALELFNQFLASLEAQPWRRWALWLSWSVYTPSARAMALNNIGAAQSGLGKVDEAERTWRLALVEDSLFAIPYANLSATAALRGDRLLSKELLDKTATLGYSGTALDRATARAQQLLASAEQNGPSL